MENTEKKLKFNKKTANIIINTILIVVFVLVAVIFINVIMSLGKGYTSFFGKSALTVSSGSMNGFYDQTADLADDNTQNGSAKGSPYAKDYEFKKGFKKGDLIFINILSDKEKQNLKVGDIITFNSTINEIPVLISHRILALGEVGTDGKFVQVTTHGDNNLEGMVELKNLDDVIGVYSGTKIGGLGTVISFFNSPTGFLICVVIPSFLILGYCVYLVIVAIKARNKESAELVKEQMKYDLETEKQKMRQQLIEELKAEKDSSDDKKE